MRFNRIIAFAAMPAAFGCAALPQPSEAHTAVEVVKSDFVETNAVVYASVTNTVVDVATTNIVPVNVDYPDDTSDDFCVEDWAEELAKNGKQGIHVKNGRALDRKSVV